MGLTSVLVPAAVGGLAWKTLQILPPPLLPWMDGWWSRCGYYGGGGEINTLGTIKNIYLIAKI